MTGHQWDPTCRPSHRLDNRIQDFNGPGKQGHRATLESPAWISALELPRFIHPPVATQDSRRRNHNNDLEHAGTMNNEGSEIKFKLMKNFKKLDGGMSKGCRSWWLAKQEVDLGGLRELMMDREAGVLQSMGSQRVGHN